MRAAAAAIAGGAAAAALYLALRRRRKTDKDDTRIIEVLDFWFKGADRGRKLWFARGSDRDAADALVRDRFAGVVEEALSGKLEHWRRTPRGSIALVVVLALLLPALLGPKGGSSLALAAQLELAVAAAVDGVGAGAGKAPLLLLVAALVAAGASLELLPPSLQACVSAIEWLRGAGRLPR